MTNKKKAEKKVGEILKLTNEEVVFTRKVSRAGGIGQDQKVFTIPRSISFYFQHGKQYEITVKPINNE